MHGCIRAAFSSPSAQTRLSARLFASPRLLACAVLVLVSSAQGAILLSSPPPPPALSEYFIIIQISCGRRERRLQAGYTLDSSVLAQTEAFAAARLPSLLPRRSIGAVAARAITGCSRVAGSEDCLITLPSCGIDDVDLCLVMSSESTLQEMMDAVSGDDFKQGILTSLDAPLQIENINVQIVPPDWKLQFYDQNLTWYEAKAACEARGGNLPLVLSIEQHHYTAAVAGNQGFWLSDFHGGDDILCEMFASTWTHHSCGLSSQVLACSGTPPSPPTPPFPPAPPPADCSDCGLPVSLQPGCDDSCYDADGVCRDGGDSASDSSCRYGTDCTDCGPRAAPSSGCLDACADLVSDGFCDDGGVGAEYNVCFYGTDCTDCGPRDVSFGCLDFESMTELRERGQWCGDGGRSRDPIACNSSYVVTFPNDRYTPGYFHTPREYRSPNVRVQRQRCVHNNLEGDAGRCSMEAVKYQCAVPSSLNCSAAFANDLQRPGPGKLWCGNVDSRSQCEASYVRAGRPWTLNNGIQGRNYLRCDWVQGRCVMSTGFNCRDPDQGLECIDVWNTVVTAGGQTCGSLARALARDQGTYVRGAAVQIGYQYPACAP